MDRLFVLIGGGDFGSKDFTRFCGFPSSVLHSEDIFGHSIHKAPSGTLEFNTNKFAEV